MTVSARRSLLAIVAGRILTFGLIAMSIEVAIVFAEYWSDDEGLGRSLIEIETGRLATGLADADGRVVFTLPTDMAARYDTVDPLVGPDDLAHGYHVRVRTLDGNVLFTNCGLLCTEHFLPLTVSPPSFWQRSIAPGKPLSLAGGRSFDVAGKRVTIELAILRDPDSLVFSVIAHETFDHMVVPMTLMLTLVIGATIWSIRTALLPVHRAAEQADRLDPNDSRSRLTITGMPKEVALLATAVNRAFGRVGELILAQKLFASAIAHEIRTPTAIVRLELEHIDHPRARKALADLDSLTHVLEQLTALARLDAVDRRAFHAIDLSALAADTVAAMAPWIYDRGKTIAFVDDGAATVEAVPSLIENLIRNLIENAVRHTPPGTAITVHAGPGAEITVADTGPGLGLAIDGADLEGGIAKPSGGLGIGRKIVQRIADLHQATVETTADPAGGIRVTLRFP